MLALLGATLCAQACIGSAQAQSPQVVGEPSIPTPAPVPVAAAISMQEVALEMQTRLAKLPSVRGIETIEAKPNELRIMAYSEINVRLDTLHTRLNAPGANREGEYRRFVSNVASLLTRNDPFKLAQLRVVIRTSTAINLFEEQTAFQGHPNAVLRRPFVEGLEEVVVGDTPTTIALMPIGRLADLNLGVTQAFDLARANTAAAIQEVHWIAKDGLLEAPSDLVYATSLLTIDAVWSGLQRQLGGPVAVTIPTRDRLVVGRADRPRDIKRLKAIAATSSGSGALSSTVLIRRGSNWVVN
ncbi:hypothetical protein [Candidatus Phycosocius spiralis]|nr:hypothetical protein [Candidatus Phycosocius spiralis]